MAASKPRMSNSTPRSRATSAVRSVGKPKVSYSSNTTAPGSWPAVKPSKARVNRSMPRAKVSANRSSSVSSAPSMWLRRASMRG